MSVETALHRLRGRPKHAAQDPGAARRLLTTPTTSALALHVAAKDVLGDFTNWEPESIWLELERRGLEIPTPNRVKLQAALALLLVPSFYWDGVVFEKTALAFDHVVTNPNALEEATSAQLAWAVKEAAWILAQHGDPARDFGHEPTSYAAVVLHREGFVVAPEALALAQPQLDRLNGSDENERARVVAAWAALDRRRLDTSAFAESPADVQLARLAVVELQVQDRKRQAGAELSALNEHP